MFFFFEDFDVLYMDYRLGRNGMGLTITGLMHKENQFAHEWY